LQLVGAGNHFDLNELLETLSSTGTM